jgi:hypothetical protein
VERKEEWPEKTHSSTVHHVDQRLYVCFEDVLLVGMIAIA